MSDQFDLNDRTSPSYNEIGRRGIAGNLRDEEMPVQAEMPMGQDIHSAINEISEIDREIDNLHAQRGRAIQRIEKAMANVQEHYHTTVNSKESPDRRVQF